MNEKNFDKQETTSTKTAESRQVEFLVIRRNNLERKLETQRKTHANIIDSFRCGKCKNLETRIKKIDRMINGV